MRRILLVLLCLFSSAQAADWPVFVSVDWLADNLARPNLKLLEISDAVSYEFDGHIPGARLTSKEYWRQQGADGVRTHLPVNELQSRIRLLGINDDDHVVIYYKGKGLTEVQGAFYAYWIFDLLGHDAVSILDGGWHSWSAAKGTSSDKAVVPEAGNFTAHHRPALEMDVETLHDLYLKHPVVDGRPHNYWLGYGKFDANIKYGRIPGSFNQPWEEFLKTDADGLTYADASLPIGLLARHPLDKNKTVLVTCFGAAGSAMVYAYLKAAGFKHLRMDDEGYKRWNLHDYPLVIGPP